MRLYPVAPFLTRILHKESVLDKYKLSSGVSEITVINIMHILRRLFFFHPVFSNITSLFLRDGRMIIFCKRQPSMSLANVKTGKNIFVNVCLPSSLFLFGKVRLCCGANEQVNKLFFIL